MTFRRKLEAAAVLAALSLGLVIALMISSRSWGQQVTASNALWYQLRAGMLWLCLALSLIYSGWASFSGVGCRSRSPLRYRELWRSSRSCRLAGSSRS